MSYKPSRAYISSTQTGRSRSKTIYSRPGTLSSEHQFPEQLQDFLSPFQRRREEKRKKRRKDFSAWMLYLGPIAGLGTAALDGEGSWALLLVEGGVEGRTDLVSPAEVRTRTRNINNKSFQKKVE